MLWRLLWLLPLAGCGRAGAPAATSKERREHAEEAVAAATRPHIYHCRSPNMEDFSCWWHPLENLTDGEDVRYVLTYYKDKGPVHECPDYSTAGPNSCHFDSSHTSIWKIYCMNVTAVTARRNYTSQQHCLDVVDIVQTEAPVNLTYELRDAGGDEMGHNAVLSWRYPVPADLRYGWITLVYELQYRRLTEPDNWKVKHPLREPRVELLGLPVGDYVVRVRCRSHNYGLWSTWSAPLAVSVPGKAPAGKLLVLILAAGVGVVALLVVTFGVLPQSKRIKEYFLPPIPKPRIIGVDPLLLKKGNLDQINNHFSSFHGYRPPSYSEEVWDHASVDDVCLTAPGGGGEEREAPAAPRDFPPATSDLPARSPASHVPSLPAYCSLPAEAFAPPKPETATPPGTGYSVAVPAPASLPPPPSARAPQDFYTCVQLLNESGEVHLVPCAPSPYCQEFPPPPAKEESRKRAPDCHGRKSGGYSERGEAAVPLLPAALDHLA